MSSKTVRFKDMTVARGTELYDVIVEKKDKKLAEKLYKKANTEFLAQYPQCTKEWFDRINGRV